MSEDERAIRQLVDDWLAATRASDIDTVLSLMTDDVVFLVPGEEPFGKQEFARMFEGMKDVRIDGTGKIEEVTVVGELAYIRNYLELTVSAPGADAPARRSGHTLTILRKEPDGHWRLARDANFVG